MSPRVLKDGDLIFWFHSYDAARESRASVHVGKGTQNDFFTAEHDRNQAKDQNAGQQNPRGGSHLDLVDQETVDRVGDTNSVDQQDREDRHEVEQRDDAPCALSEMLHYNIRKLCIWLARGKNKACQPAVGKVGHRKGENRQQYQWPETTQANVDRQKQDAGTDCSAK